MLRNDISYKHRCQNAIRECLTRFPIQKKNRLVSKIEIIPTGSMSCIHYDVSKSSPKIQSLIALGAIDDLTDSALVGLVAHLYALHEIGYDRHPIPIGEEWLATDLCSDNIARGWGFQHEVDKLREVRQQKIPPLVTYPDIILSYSALSSRFAEDVGKSMVDSRYSTTQPSIGNHRVWYIDKFSMLCSLQKLRQDKVKSLHIVTSNYTKKRLHELMARVNE